MTVYSVDVRLVGSAGHDQYRAVVYRDGKCVWAVKVDTFAEALSRLLVAHGKGVF